MAKKRLLAKVPVKAQKGELIFFKNGALYAVKMNRGGKKGRKVCRRKSKRKSR